MNTPEPAPEPALSTSPRRPAVGVAGALPADSAVRRIKAPKAADAASCHALEQLPNIGPSLAADLRQLGIERPEQLRGEQPLALYRRLCEVSGQRQDPCVLDTFIAAIDFMSGAPARPWWHYTPFRKQAFGTL